MTRSFDVYVDGGSRGNPGPAAAGVVLLDADTGQPVFEAGYFLGRMTNNAAEYNGLIKALEACIAHEAQRVCVTSDSQLMVRQILGEYRVKSADLQPLHTDAKALLGRIGDWKIRHVLRENNKRADELANVAMDAGDDVIIDKQRSARASVASHAETGNNSDAKTPSQPATSHEVQCPHCGKSFDPS